MTNKENTKTLYGNVEQNDYYYLWHSEPGACEKCLSMDGKTFDDANTIPDKPHPNCKCWLERKKYISSDPIQYHRDKIQERKNLELEFEKLNGDLRCIEAECNKSIEIINNELDTIEQIEYTINPEYLKPLDVEKIQEVKQELENNKQEVMKAKVSITKYKDNFTPSGTIKEISAFEFKIIELKNIMENVSNFLYKLNLISKLRKPLMNCGINWAKYNSEPDAVELWNIGAYKGFENNPYIETNGKVIKNIEEIQNNDLQEFVTKKIKKQLGSIHKKGVWFHQNSSLSLSYSNSEDFKNFIKSKKDELLKNRTCENSSIEFIHDSNLYHAIHFSDIVDIHIDNQLNLHAKIVDTYDFNDEGYFSLVGQARILQQHGELETYYTITDILIPNEIWKQY